MSSIAALSCNQGIKNISMQWHQATQLPALHLQPSPGFAGPVAGLLHNDVVIAGGANFPDAMPWMGGKKVYYNQVYRYQQADNQLQLISESRLPDTIAYPAVCTTPLGIVYAGGETQAGLSSKVWLMKTDSSNTIGFDALPNLTEPTANAGMTIFQNELYIVGGETAKGASAEMFRLSLANPQRGWQPLAALPHPASHGVFLTQGTQLFYIGGRMKTASGISNLYAQVYAYDVQNNQWSSKAPLPYALSAGTGAAIGNEYLILFGGDKGKTFHKTETLIAAIAAETNPQKKEILNREKIQLQSNHPGFSNEVLLYNIAQNQWSVAGTIPFATPVTTTALVTDKSVYLPSGEIKAGVRSPTILKVDFKD